MSHKQLQVEWKVKQLFIHLGIKQTLYSHWVTALYLCHYSFNQNIAFCYLHKYNTEYLNTFTVRMNSDTNIAASHHHVLYFLAQGCVTTPFYRLQVWCDNSCWWISMTFTWFMWCLNFSSRPTFRSGARQPAHNQQIQASADWTFCLVRRHQTGRTDAEVPRGQMVNAWAACNV